MDQLELDQLNSDVTEPEPEPGNWQELELDLKEIHLKD